MSRTVVITFDDGSQHTYRNVPETVTREQVTARVAKEFSARNVTKIERLALGDAPGDIPRPAAVTTEQMNEVGRAQAAAANNPPSLLDRAVGVGEAGLTLATGATGGALGAVQGGLAEAARAVLSGEFGTAQAAQAIEQAAAAGGERFTYAPRTPAGQEAVGALGEAAQALLPVAGLTGPASAAGVLAGPAAAQGGAALAQGAQRAAAVAAPLVDRAVEAGRAALRPAEAPAAGRAAGGSVGAAGVDLARLRQGLADELPVPIPLIKGQASRSYADQQEMMVLARDPTVGEPIRERLADQRAAMIQNMDSFLDETGAETRDLRSAGEAVEGALRAQAASDKRRIRALYQAAEKAGEMDAPVTLQGLADYVNGNKAESAVVDILKGARAKGLELGLFAEGPDGALAAQPVPIKTAEIFRQSINKLMKKEDSRDMMFAGEVKSAFDEAMDSQVPDTANLYRQGRQARAEYGATYERQELTKQLLGTKRGTVDRAVALEDVVRKVMLSPSTSLDQLRATTETLRRTPQGQQAWRELQGATIQHLQERALSNVARDERGTPIFSAAKFDTELKALDRSGKLEYIFGKQGAERLRTLNEVAKVIFTSVPGTVNSSNTATTLAAMIDLFGASATGVPVPAVTAIKIIRDRVRDKKLRAKVEAQLAGIVKGP